MIFSLQVETITFKEDLTNAKVFAALNEKIEQVSWIITKLYKSNLSLCC